jgi:hypothetical protein
MASQIKKFLEGNLDTVIAPYGVQCNKTRTKYFEQSSVQLDQFMI